MTLAIQPLSVPLTRLISHSTPASTALAQAATAAPTAEGTAAKSAPMVWQTPP